LAPGKNFVHSLRLKIARKRFCRNGASSKSIPDLHALEVSAERVEGGEPCRKLEEAELVVAPVGAGLLVDVEVFAEPGTENFL
jgi:hypothetical protein